MAAVNTVVMVCASRGWDDPQPIEARLADIYRDAGGANNMFVIHGDFGGGARIASEWCDRWHVQHKRFVTKWHKDGVTAVQARDNEMLDFLADQRDDMGAKVEVVVFRRDAPRVSDELDRVVRLASGMRLTGSIVQQAA